MQFEFRWYQKQAITNTFDWLYKNPGNPCVVIPTAGGKSPIMAGIIKETHSRWDGVKGVVLAHRKELIQQNFAALNKVWPGQSAALAGIYSSGLGRRDTHAKITFAGIQSVYNKAYSFEKLNYILADECHHFSINDGKMYKEFYETAKQINPKVRFIGVSATPYRMKGGMVYGDREECLFDDVSYEIGIRPLVDEGYLCPLVVKGGPDPEKAQAIVNSLGKVAGDYNQKQANEAFSDHQLIADTVKDIKVKAEGRNAIIVFCSGVEHAELVSNELNRQGISSRCLTQKAKKQERSNILTQFSRRQFRALVNVDILTEGFDDPAIDCVVCLRATLSPGLMYQIAGRGFRIHPNKKDCLLLDYVNNLMVHGPIDQINDRVAKKVAKKIKGNAPMKQCPNCDGIMVAAIRQCEICGHEFDFEKNGYYHNTQAGEHAALSWLEDEKKPVVHDVYQIRYRRHTPRREGAKTSLKVSYYGKAGIIASDWVFLEHSRFARSKAINWWCEHTGWSADSVPKTVDEGIELANAGALLHPKSIETRPDEKNPKFTKVSRRFFIEPKVFPMPEPVNESDDYDIDEIPEDDEISSWGYSMDANPKKEEKIIFDEDVIF